MMQDHADQMSYRLQRRLKKWRVKLGFGCFGGIWSDSGRQFFFPHQRCSLDLLFRFADAKEGAPSPLGPATGDDLYQEGHQIRWLVRQDGSWLHCTVCLGWIVVSYSVIVGGIGDD